MIAPTFTDVPRLTEISSFTAAIALWKNKDIRRCTLVKSGNISNRWEWHSFVKEIHDLVIHDKDNLPIPALVEKQVLTYVYKIKSEIINWVEYHHRNVFFHYHYDYSLLHHMCKLVWHSDGSIDYVKTALALLSSNRLSDMEKFRLMSVYCLEDEMNKMSPSLYSDDNEDNEHFQEYPLIYYWNCHFRNELHLIPGVNATQSVHHFMALHREVNNWPAKEYFFDRLNCEEQVECARALIIEHGLKYQKLVLMKLNEIQRNVLYSLESVRIMGNYSESCHSYENLLSTWIELRNLINPEQLVAIFDKMITNRVDGARITDMLKDMDAKVRKEIIEKDFFVRFCEELLKSKKFTLLDRLMSLCEPKFKQNLVINSATIEKTCLDYYSSDSLEKLNELLTSLLTDKEVILKYKKKVLMSNEGISSCSSYIIPFRKKNTLRRIIADSLPTEELATEFKKRLILSNSGVHHLRGALYRRHVNVVRKCIDDCLQSEEDKTSLKKRLLDDVEILSILILRYESSQWKSLLDLCFATDEDVEEFKNTINLDSLFNEVLKYCVFEKYDDRHLVAKCTFVEEEEFNPVDKFRAADMLLQWYFSSPIKINLYKMKRVFLWMEIEMITTLLKKKDPVYLKAVMEWFFKDNNKAAAKFKKKFAGQRIVEML